MSYIIIMCILLIILVVLRIQHKPNHFKEGFESSKSVIICKADWCGHCKKAEPEFQKLLKSSPITLQDGTQATVKILDADKDKSEIDLLKCKGFPTIFIKDNEDIQEYPGERTYDGIFSFLNSN